MIDTRSNTGMIVTANDNAITTHNNEVASSSNTQMGIANMVVITTSSDRNRFELSRKLSETVLRPR